MRIIKWIVIVLVAVVLLFQFVAKPYLKEQTKKHSPQITNTFQNEELQLQVTYSSPFKKGRVIFGELVPYDVVWRTGANEPTTFRTESDITIMGNSLAAGTYSLWTKPGKENWSVYFNHEVPDWGVTISSGGRETTRNPEKDAVVVQVPVIDLQQTEESFTIDFSEEEMVYMNLYWDTTKVRIPITP
ncbi:DUF2911 domain-containing protein [Zeaxanthinibacter sp. PT1]|uniref:DUF2911 domain-containing protein n=1 Tax=Zeaxanthinibacter TaxID=561554 RepID=UPI00234AE2CE|nr:DUF2911 domain-containing protein [Zeaxanthinibacter sp. PT1]MDC6352561.1 DUF2911 domain-containing protein [Zeaxanthinibacter sp. PT1]